MFQKIAHEDNVKTVCSKKLLQVLDRSQFDFDIGGGYFCQIAVNIQGNFPAALDIIDKFAVAGSDIQNNIALIYVMLQEILAKNFPQPIFPDSFK